LGLAGVPQAGDDFLVVKDEKVAKQIVERREEKAKESEIAKSPAKITIEDFYQKLQGEETKEVHLIVKGDVQGSIEAITESVKQLSTDKCKVDIVHTGVGQITENDIMLASASDDGGAKKLAEQEKVEIRIYGVIYELIEDLKRIMLGKLEPTYVEKVVGHAEVRAVFPIAKVGNVAGCYVTDGKVVRSGKARVMRNGKEVWSGNIENLKRFKDEVREVAQANECGIKLEGFNEFQEGDVIEIFVLEEVAPTL
jgi:translation initiation factor IF-2